MARIIKPIAISLCFSIFIVSFIFLVSGITGNLNINLVTGAAIGSSQLTSYASVSMIISLIMGLLILRSMRKMK